MNLHDYLNAPIPRKKAIAVVLTQAVSNLIMLQTLSTLVVSSYKREIDDQKERLRIYNETTEFLMEHADDATMSELNKKLDYWRVVRGMPAVATVNVNRTGTTFEAEFGYDIELAQSWVNDLYKAPEQRMMAQAFLNEVERLGE